MGTGPIVSGMEWPPEQISAFAGDVDVAVTGSLNEQNGTLRITLMVWDSVSKKAVNAFSYTCDRDHLGSTVLTIERKLLDYFSPLSGKPDVPVEGFYVRPAPAIMASYLSCLGQTLMMTFVQNEYVPREQMWGGRQMFDSYLWTVAEMKDARSTSTLPGRTGKKACLRVFRVRGVQGSRPADAGRRKVQGKSVLPAVATVVSGFWHGERVQLCARLNWQGGC